MEEFDWAVIGAGPAGIAAVGKLLDAGVAPKRLAWIDPAFAVGDFGTKWRNVSSNTKVKKVINFYRAPLRYAIDLGDEILFDDTGLKRFDSGLGQNSFARHTS